jgi:DNA-binding MarR family transcriptional regulator
MDAETKALGKLNDALALARRHDPDMGIHDLMAVLLVAKREKTRAITQAELGETLKLSTATKSRVVSRLTPEGTLGKPGLGLIRQEIDESNRRERLLTLTQKGRKFVSEVAAALTR